METRRLRLSEEQVAQYEEDGFVIIRGLFTKDELAPIAATCREDPTFGGRTVDYGTQGAPTPLLSWWHLGDTLLGTIPRLARMVDCAEDLLAGESYHWHSLLVRKGPGLKSTFKWHTAYGTFYYDGCLFPDLVTCVVAVTDNTVENGCLRMLRGSHKMGRLDQMLVGGEVCADPDRMPHVLERLEAVDMVLETGDAVFFHSNTLHASGPNQTDEQRIVLVLRYNAAHNEPYDLEGQEHHRYRPLVRVPDSALVEGRYTSVYDTDDLHSPEKTGEGVGKPIVYRFGQTADMPSTDEQVPCAERT